MTTPYISQQIKIPRDIIAMQDSLEIRNLSTEGSTRSWLSAEVCLSLDTTVHSDNDEIHCFDREIHQPLARDRYSVVISTNKPAHASKPEVSLSTLKSHSTFTHTFLPIHHLHNFSSFGLVAGRFDRTGQVERTGKAAGRCVPIEEIVGSNPTSCKFFFLPLFVLAGRHSTNTSASFL